jgi:hypothetical protein
MSESVATRVDDETKQWLETRADQEDITVSALVADILESKTGDEAEPDSTEARLNEIENNIEKLTRHSAKTENFAMAIIDTSDELYLSGKSYDFPPLPGDETERSWTISRTGLSSGPEP